MLAGMLDDCNFQNTYAASVQELAQGRTLADLVASGWRADEAEAKRIAMELLGVLDYLGSRRPAVTHR